MSYASHDLICCDVIRHDVICHGVIYHDVICHDVICLDVISCRHMSWLIQDAWCTMHDAWCMMHDTLCMMLVLIYLLSRQDCFLLHQILTWNSWDKRKGVQTLKGDNTCLGKEERNFLYLRYKCPCIAKISFLLLLVPWEKISNTHTYTRTYTSMHTFSIII